MKNRKLTISKTISKGTFALCLSLLIASVAIGQIAPPPSEDIDSPKVRRIKTSPEARVLAEDYLAILEQLEVLTADYGTYLAEMSDKLAAFERKRLAVVATRLATGQYYDDISRLQKDLNDLQSELKKYRHNTTDLQKDEATVLRNLHRDVALLNTTFEFEVLEELMDNDALWEQLSVAVELAIPKPHDRHSRLQKIMIKLDDTIITLNLQDIDFDALEDISFEMPDFPAIAFVPDAPAVFPAPKVERYFQLERGIAGFTREFLDSIDVPSGNTPILISNPYGDVIVSGWSGDKILVRSEIEATAADEDKTKELAKKVSLSLCPKPEGLCVEFILPHLGDLGTVVTRSVLEVKVPMDNPIQCSNGFGKLRISDITSSVRINSANSSIEVTEVIGDVRISSTSGKIHLTDLSGDLWINNTNGTIIVDDCEGTFNVENQYGQIAFNDCQGDATIVNNGPMHIIDHTGNITLVNQGAMIEVQRLDGNVVATTSMSPIHLIEVDGSADISNSHGLVDVFEVTGMLTIHNSYAPIQVRYPSGLLNLTNQNSAIDVVLTEPIDGSSYIVSNSGIVRLAWEEDMDILLDAKTKNGTINSAWPISVKSIGGLQTAQLTFGSEDHKILISGDHSNIYLTEAR